MPVNCIACVRFTFKRSKKMAPLGFGNCSLKPDWELRSAVFDHECSSFARSSKEQEEKGRAWLATTGEAKQDGNE